MAAYATRNLASLREGTHIQLLEMPNDPDPIPTGTLGVIDYHGPMGQVHVVWENRRTLILLDEIDLVMVLDYV